MCRNITVYATDDEGNPYPDVPAIDFSDFEAEFPTCTCWIGDAKGDGAALRHLFTERCLQPMLRAVSWGKIVIEVH